MGLNAAHLVRFDREPTDFKRSNGTSYPAKLRRGYIHQVMGVDALTTAASAIEHHALLRLLSIVGQPSKSGSLGRAITVSNLTYGSGTISFGYAAGPYEASRAWVVFGIIVQVLRKVGPSVIFEFIFGCVWYGESDEVPPFFGLRRWLCALCKDENG